ncbi:VOC family protein [Streptomyces fuscichromogenes]|uniref:Hydroxylase n=1 Tax=Streptomyces fuscichromogenes TaxID=1324013 RepID=A0A918CS08_9ACTN|nr:VOC family protein [Streptomyces fuscichromogenes]GGN12361.1 hydroxylase [Streptomyces fuscichromogenes]
MLMTPYVPGAPNWLDVGTPDIDASVAFYSAVFGWQHRSAGPAAGGYGFFEQDGGTVAGIGPLTEEGASPSWTVYFHTPDADATAEAVERAGGSVRVAPADVLTAGRAAAFTDPAGADFAVWQPGDTQGLDLVAVPGSLARTELYTTDAAAAKAFYGSVFSWQTRDVPMGPELTYTVLAPAGAGPTAAHGGLMQLPQANLDAGSTPEWHPYFEVSDCDATLARATEAGATVLVPVTDAPGIGRFAMFLDPVGALLAAITTAGR